MTQHHYQQPPIFDLNNLDDNHEIRMDYDANGNLTRVRKVRRFEGCLVWMIILIVAIAIGIGWDLFVPKA